jgi:hypothetical protein
VNTFALELFDDQGSRCTFYTVRWDDSELSETERFFHKFRNHKTLGRPLQELAMFLNIIADESSALKEYFKFENKADALPPSGWHRAEEIIIDFNNFPLRLYCLRISETLVILFSGAEKTSKSAQDGKTSMVFREANQFAERILEALRQNDIYITANGRKFRKFDDSDDIIL